MQTGPSASTHLESGGFARTGTDVAHPDVQMHFLPSQVIDHGRKPAVIEAFQVHNVGDVIIMKVSTVIDSLNATFVTNERSDMIVFELLFKPVSFLRLGQ